MDRFAFDRARLRGFARLGRDARRRDPSWPGEARTTLERQFAREHPMWRRCEHTCFLAADARCVALVNPRVAEADGAPFGQLGWFEAMSEAGARRVLDAGLAWLGERGCRTAIGPMHGSTWHSYRFVTEWGAEPPFLLEPSNPPSYPAWWRAHGFTPGATSYTSSQQDNRAAATELARGRTAAEALGYRVVHANLGDFDVALRRIFDISREVFAGNPFYAEIEWDEFTALYDGVGRILEPRLFHWLLAPDDEVVGFGFGLPDRFAAIQRMRGRRGPLAKLGYLTAPRPRRSIFKSMGILGPHQGKGLASALFHEQAVQANQLGLDVGIRALMADGNRSFATGRALHQVVRRYELFTRSVA